MSDQPIFPTREGPAIGGASERTMLDKVGVESFRTEIREGTNGETTRLRTRGGHPEFVTTGPKSMTTEAVKEVFVGVPVSTANRWGFNKVGAGMAPGTESDPGSASLLPVAGGADIIANRFKVFGTGTVRVKEHPGNSSWVSADQKTRVSWWCPTPGNRIGTNRATDPMWSAGSQIDSVTSAWLGRGELLTLSDGSPTYYTYSNAGAPFREGRVYVNGKRVHDFGCYVLAAAIHVSGGVKFLRALTSNVSISISTATDIDHVTMREINLETGDETSLGEVTGMAFSLRFASFQPSFNASGTKFVFADYGYRTARECTFGSASSVALTPEAGPAETSRFAQAEALLTGLAGAGAPFVTNNAQVKTLGAWYVGDQIKTLESYLYGMHVLPGADPITETAGDINWCRIRVGGTLLETCNFGGFTLQTTKTGTYTKQYTLSGFGPFSGHMVFYNAIYNGVAGSLGGWEPVFFGSDNGCALFATPKQKGDATFSQSLTITDSPSFNNLEDLNTYLTPTTAHGNEYEMMFVEDAAVSLFNLPHASNVPNTSGYASLSVGRNATAAVVSYGVMEQLSRYDVLSDQGIASAFRATLSRKNGIWSNVTAQVPGDASAFVVGLVATKIIEKGTV